MFIYGKKKKFSESYLDFFLHALPDFGSRNNGHTATMTAMIKKKMDTSKKIETMATRSESSVDMIEEAFIDYITPKTLNTMENENKCFFSVSLENEFTIKGESPKVKAINKQPKNLGTIKMALFVATHVTALKGSEMWHRCNDLLNWLDQFDEKDIVIITNDADLIITFKED